MTTATAAAQKDAVVHKIAAEAFAALNNTGRQVPSFSARYPDFTVDGAYRVIAVVNEMRVAQGYKPLGRKIGFTNPRLWDEYGVRAPIWGYVYDRTIHDLSLPLPLARYSDPKIEPEIMVGLAAAPSPSMDDAALLRCIAWIAHGFEIVQSIFPGWKFSAADCVAANGLHGALLIGSHHEIGAHADEWLRTLRQFEIELYCNGQLMDHGGGSKVLEGPLSTIRYLMDLLARDPDNPPLAAGEIISTGTLTRALPVKPGETWTTKLTGIALKGVSLRFE